MNTDYIIVTDYIRHSHIEPQFFALLEEAGLVHTQEFENERYIFADDLPELDRYARMYYDLSINIEGIDAIRHLLQRIQDLQTEMRDLRNRLQFWE
jgi:hypothetical protein